MKAYRRRRGVTVAAMRAAGMGEYVRIKWKDYRVPFPWERQPPGRSTADIGSLLGVARQTVGDWLSKKATNANDGIGCIPDSRVVIPKKEIATIIERVESGEKQRHFPGKLFCGVYFWLALVAAYMRITSMGPINGHRCSHQGDHAGFVL